MVHRWISTTLAASRSLGWPTSETGGSWAQLIARAERAIEEFGLTDVEPLDGGFVAVTLSARAPDGTPVVLKVAPPDAVMCGESLLGEYCSLTPRVLAIRDDGLTLLLERVVPGVPLGRSPRAVQAHVCGSLTRGLRETGGGAANDPRIPRFTSWYEPRLQELVAACCGHDQYPRELAAIARRAFAFLAESPHSLIHGDLHGGNILRADQSRWVMIDAKAMWGPSCFDIAFFLLESQVMSWDERLVDLWAAAAHLPVRDVRYGIFFHGVWSASRAFLDDAGESPWATRRLSWLRDRVVTWDL